MSFEVGKVPSRVERAETKPAADLAAHREQVEWLPSSRGRRGQPTVTVTKSYLQLSTTSWREMLGWIGIEPPCEVNFAVGWMRLERQIVIQATQDSRGEYKVKIHEGHPTGIKIGGRLTIAMLQARGVQLGQYPAILDAQNQRLLVNTHKPQGSR